MTLVKICGIQDADSAHVAAEAGADLLGFVFAPGRRRIAPETARSIVQSLASPVQTVGVFVDEDPAEVQRIADYCGLSAVQLHGRESPAYCRRFTVPVIKALRVGSTPGELDRAVEYPVWALLVDTLVPGQAGGTGRTFDWNLLTARTFSRPLVLAGGLNSANVQEAITTVRPYAVDVSSGVETAGRKDPVKIRDFIKLAKEAL
ncbi:MAG: phosphoribosylanthranilate isomerase [Candidatus Desulforudis sp.]|nr:phosphoribosylanthranilate isomerase [Desulforudis sp.]